MNYRLVKGRTYHRAEACAEAPREIEKAAGSDAASVD